MHLRRLFVLLTTCAVCAFSIFPIRGHADDLSLFTLNDGSVPHYIFEIGGYPSVRAVASRHLNRLTTIYDQRIAGPQIAYGITTKKLYLAFLDQLNNRAGRFYECDPNSWSCTFKGSMGVYIPVGLACDPAGNIWAAFSLTTNPPAQYFGRINTSTGAVITSSIKKIESLASEEQGTLGISFDSAGTLWVADKRKIVSAYSYDQRFYSVNTNTGAFSPRCGTAPNEYPCYQLCLGPMPCTSPNKPYDITGLAVHPGTGEVFASRSTGRLMKITVSQSPNALDLGLVKDAFNSGSSNPLAFGLTWAPNFDEIFNFGPSVAAW